jgi:hypothetical protein
MLSWQFWAPVFAGVVCLLIARFIWVQGQRRRSLALRWWSLAYVAFALCAGLAAVAHLANLYASELWYALELAALFLAICTFVGFGVYAIWEALRGSGMQQYRS